MKRRKRYGAVLAMLLMLAVGMAGCGNRGKLNEGDCKCTIVFTDIPRELSMLEENIQENFHINLTLRNLANDKLYKIVLNASNDYKAEISLHPGTYQVCYPFVNPKANLALSLSTDKENVTLSPETPSTISIRVDNPEEFTEHWMSIQPMPEMLLADTFCGQVQIDRRIVAIEEILPYLNLTYTKQVTVGEKLTLTDEPRGVTVYLQNRGTETTDWKSCTVYGIHVTKNNVVFPKGVTLGMSAQKVCHTKDGLFGEPDSLTGTLLFGWGMGEVNAVYKDPVSGDRIQLDLGSDGSSIQSITYLREQFD